MSCIMNTIIRHLGSSPALKCQIVLLILPIHPQRLQREVRIRPIVVGFERSHTDGDNWNILYFEAFHTVHSCSQSYLFIPTQRT